VSLKTRTRGKFGLDGENVDRRSNFFSNNFHTVSILWCDCWIKQIRIFVRLTSRVSQKYHIFSFVKHLWTRGPANWQLSLTKNNIRYLCGMFFKNYLRHRDFTTKIYCWRRFVFVTTYFKTGSFIALKFNKNYFVFKWIRSQQKTDKLRPSSNQWQSIFLQNAIANCNIFYA